MIRTSSLLLAFTILTINTYAACLPSAKKPLGKETIILGKGSWSSILFDNEVAKIILEESLGLPVQISEFNELDPAGQLSSGVIDAFLEVWSGDYKLLQHSLDSGTVLDAGLLGVIGQIGWYWPKYTVSAEPYVANFNSLTKGTRLWNRTFAECNHTLLFGPSSWVTVENSIINWRGYPLTIQYCDSNEDLISNITAKYYKTENFLFYLWSPSWLLGAFNLTRVTLPSVNECLGKSVSDWNCDYEQVLLRKVISPNLKVKSKNAATLLTLISFTTADHISALVRIETEKKNASQVACEWILTHESTWMHWISGLSSSSMTVGSIVAIICSVILFCVITFIATFTIMRRKQRKQKVQFDTERRKVFELSKMTSLIFDANITDVVRQSTEFLQTGLSSQKAKDSQTNKHRFEPQDLKLCTSEELEIVLSKTTLDFGIENGKPFPVLTPLTDSITLSTKNSNHSRVFIHFQSPGNKFVLVCDPESLKLQRKKPKTIQITGALRCTASTTITIFIEVLGVGYMKLENRITGSLSPFLDPDDLTIGERVLGEGTNSRVLLGSWRGTDVAVKYFKNQILSASEMQEFIKEMEILSTTRHPYIVNFIGGICIPGKVSLVMEYIKHGSLKSVILKKRKLSTLMRLKIARNIAQGMSFLHASGILHRDLKADNVLVVSLSSKVDINAKISDFGSSRKTTFKTEAKEYTLSIGTPISLAPEVLMGHAYSNKIDVYSFGILLYFIFAGESPYIQIPSSWEVVRFVTLGGRPKFSENIHQAIRSLAERCWEQDAAIRPSFNDIIPELEKIINAVQSLPISSPNCSSSHPSEQQQHNNINNNSSNNPVNEVFLEERESSRSTSLVPPLVI